jgi:oligopeptide/dipeptide ABC transporter ATP-binding protein
MGPAIRMTNVSKVFAGRAGESVTALDGVTMGVDRGAIVAVIGESGSGKSSLARIVLGLISPDCGTVEVLGEDLRALSGAGRRDLRRKVTAVFQEPYDSLDPRMTVRQIVEEPLVVHFPSLRRVNRLDVCIAALRSVSLEPRLATRYPHELSGGQQQRVSLARAFITLPELVVLDEPTSALDASTRGQVLDVLSDLQAGRGVTLLLVSHDVSTVRRLADQVVVLYRGRIVESGPASDVLGDPIHPYTRVLLSSEMTIGTARARDGIAVAATDSVEVPAVRATCVFRARCPLGDEGCDIRPVELRAVREGRSVACVKAPSSLAHT